MDILSPFFSQPHSTTTLVIKLENCGTTVYYVVDDFAYAHIWYYHLVWVSWCGATILGSATTGLTNSMVGHFAAVEVVCSVSRSTAMRRRGTPIAGISYTFTSQLHMHLRSCESTNPRGMAVCSATMRVTNIIDFGSATWFISWGFCNDLG